MQKIIIPISGMHCRSCEILIGDSLLEIPEIKKVDIDYKKAVADVYFENQKPNMHEIDKAIRGAGYAIGKEKEKTFFSKNPEDYQDLGIAILFLMFFYIVAKNLGIGSIDLANTGGANPSSLSVVFLVGITAGLSTCMALVGGLILGISARHSEKHPEATAAQKFRPHLFFNLGRILGYAVFGAVLGALGSVLQLSSTVLGVLTIAVGFVMLALGLKLTGMFPRMENGGMMLSKGISKFLGIKNNHEKEYSHGNSMLIGALTFFLPCGFTQTMQLYAISTGSFSRGAMIMGIFALGTAPGLLGVGGLTSIVKGIFAKRFYKFAGILVVFLAMFNIANGYNLAGFEFSKLNVQNVSTVANKADPNVKMENGVQVVSMIENSSGYAPNKFTIKKGVPVRWEIDAQAPGSCASSIVSSKLKVRKNLVAGKNIIEFTPTETGSIPFSCSMGMYTGSFNVIDENSSVTTSSVGQDAPAATSGSCGAATNNTAGTATGSCGGSTGGCGGGGSTGVGCGGSSKPVTPSAGKVETIPTATDTQVIKTSYTLNKDIAPNTFTVKAGQPVSFVVDVKENGQGCMSSITVGGLTTDVYQLVAGKTITMNFTPTKKGVYQITCGMGVPRGTITVE